MDKLFGWVAAVVSILAGIYLLQSESASAESTVFDVLMHGIGAYFIARGLWMISSLLRGRETPAVAKPVSAQSAPAAPPETTAPE